MRHLKNTCFAEIYLVFMGVTAFRGFDFKMIYFIPSAIAFLTPIILAIFYKPLHKPKTKYFFLSWTIFTVLFLTARIGRIEESAAFVIWAILFIPVAIVSALLIARLQEDNKS